MDVTKDNFELLFPQIKKDIEECDFLAIDFELTGLESSEAATPSQMDRLQERYSKLRASVANLAPTQIGLCPTKIDPVTGKLTLLPYNVWLYPRPHQMSGYEPRFMVQASSFSFLSENHFNFNKWVSQGVSWLPGVFERKAIESGALSMENITQPSSNSYNDIPLEQIKNPKDKQLLEEALSSMNTWNECEDLDKQPLYLSASLNPFIRRLVYQEARKQFPTLILESVSHPDSPATKVIRVSKMTPEQRYQAAVEAFERSLGFRRVFKVIQSSSKPVILHNGFLDLMHYMHSFGDVELPELLTDFKMAVQSAFPNSGSLYDTSLFASSDDFAPMKVYARGLEKIFQYSLVPQRSFQVDENGKEVKPQEKPVAAAAAAEVDLTKMEDESQQAATAAAVEEEVIVQEVEVYKNVTVGFPALELDMPATFSRYTETLKRAMSFANPQPAPVEAASSSSSSPPSEAAVPAPAPAVAPNGNGNNRSSGNGAAPPAVDMKSLAHEAGYDALMTAILFGKLIAAQKFYSSKKEDVAMEVDSVGSTNPWFDHVQHVKGKVNMMRSDLKFLDVLDAKQAEPSRAHYFRVTGLTLSVRNEHIEAVFAPFGGLKRIAWSSGTECVAILNDETRIDEVVAAVCGPAASTPFTIALYNGSDSGAVPSSKNNNKRERTGAAQEKEEETEEGRGKRAKRSEKGEKKKSVCCIC